MKGCTHLCLPPPFFCCCSHKPLLVREIEREKRGYTIVCALFIITFSEFILGFGRFISTCRIFSTCFPSFYFI